MGRYRLRLDSHWLYHFTGQQSHTLIASGRERTARAYRTAARGLIAFNAGRDLPLKHLNSCLIKDFENDMKHKGKTLNTISFYMRNLRAIYNKAIACKRIADTGQNPFSDVYTGVQKTRKRSLTMDQLKTLNDLDLSLGSGTTAGAKEGSSVRDQEIFRGLDAARRLFLFCFHARGMSFVDLAYLRKENIQGKRIRYYRKKTGGLIELKITPVMQEIIHSFSLQTRDSLYIFPILVSPHKPLRLQYESGLRLQNNRLKRLARLAGIHSAVSTHVSRHSWASAAKKENLPVIPVRSMPRR
ncbi:tyrosine-type recombinase/integrase [Dysgonomonas alginatilytica]|nr:site-specific integrase [Dysgonomonas alginatilytica]